MSNILTKFIKEYYSMKKFKKALLALVLFGVIGSMVPAFGIDNLNLNRDNPVGYENLYNRICRKLGRGICNIAFGPLEIFMQASRVHFNDGALAAASYGVLQGVGYCLVREGCGIVELLTFPIPLPGCPNDVNDPNASAVGYGPILTPEWVISPATDYKNMVYSQTGIVN